MWFYIGLKNLVWGGVLGRFFLGGFDVSGLSTVGLFDTEWVWHPDM